MTIKKEEPKRPIVIEIDYWEEPHCACGADDHDDAEHEYADDEEFMAELAEMEDYYDV